MFKYNNSENSRITVMQNGMALYISEIKHGKKQETNQSLGLYSGEHPNENMSSREEIDKDNGKGLDLSI